MTPGFPLTYPREGECLWLINVNENEYIRLEFDAFELDFNSQLCMDEIFIWDGKTSSSKLLLRYDAIKCTCLKKDALFNSIMHVFGKYNSSFEIILQSVSSKIWLVLC